MYLAHTGAPLLIRVFAPCPIQGLGWVLAKDFHVVPHAKTCHYNTATQRLQQTPQAFPETEEPSPKAASHAIATTPVREKFQSWLRSFPNPVCLVRHCLKEMLACEHGDPNCAEGLACTQSCGKHNNTMGCLYSCLNSYEAQLLPGHVAGGEVCYDHDAAVAGPKLCCLCAVLGHRPCLRDSSGSERPGLPGIAHTRALTPCSVPVPSDQIV